VVASGWSLVLRPLVRVPSLLLESPGRVLERRERGLQTVDSFGVISFAFQELRLALSSRRSARDVVR